MKLIGTVFCFLLFFLSRVGLADYLEVRADAKIYKEPDRSSEVILFIKRADRSSPTALEMLSDKTVNGYYNVSVPNTDEEGWIYRSYVRRHRGDAEDASARGQRPGNVSKKFPLECDLPFPLKTKATSIDQTCGIEGEARKTAEGKNKDLSSENRAQNRMKNNLCARGTPINLDFSDFQKLQKAVDDRGIRYGGHGKLPEDRSALKSILRLSNGKTVGEGTVVQYAGYVHNPRNSNVSKGETVNCNKSNKENNDIHIDILRDPDDPVCSSITVEIVPHYRPTVWSKDSLDQLKERPFRFRGQLFFDGAHQPCKSDYDDKASPKRATVWEIHPVYAVDVCKKRKLAECKVTDESKWAPLHLAINPVHEEDEDEDEN